MIKLIVTDMDGCLLDGKGSLPSDFEETYRIIEEKGVILAAASGRSIAGLMKPFGMYAEKMAFASDNGACVYYKGRKLFSSTLERSDYLPIFEEARKHPNLIAVACGEKNAWMENIDSFTEKDVEELKKYYPSWAECRYEEIPDQVIKVALLYFDDIEKNIYPYFQRFNNDRILSKVTAYVWIDIFNAHVSKGTGIRAIQDKLGISRDETIVFGDYLNDLPMAECALKSFAPSNAHPEVKRCFTDVIGSNEEGAVTKTIRELLQ